MEFLLDLNSFGGRGLKLGRDWLCEYKKIVDGLDENTKQFLFPNTRVRKSSAKGKRK